MCINFLVGTENSDFSPSISWRCNVFPIWDTTQVLHLIQIFESLKKSRTPYAKHSILLFSNVIDPPPSPLAKNLRKHGCLLPSCIFNPTVYYTPPIFISHTFSLGSLKPTAVQPQGLLGVTTCLRLCLYAFLLEFCCYAMQSCGLRARDSTH